jgi:hypothetical protein
MRIEEERDRRTRESIALNSLPQALEELHEVLRECLSAYGESFGAESVDIQMSGAHITVAVREQRDGEWRPAATVEVTAAPELPGFRLKQGDYTVEIEVGLLPSQKFYYRDGEQNKYLTMDDLTRRILDRALFPKLTE